MALKSSASSRRTSLETGPCSPRCGGRPHPPKLRILVRLRREISLLPRPLLFYSMIRNVSTLPAEAMFALVAIPGARKPSSPCSFAGNTTLYVSASTF